ncbi:UNVERIFIED_CONTAM: Alpha-N-acetylglucosaminidase [Sesamum angustifolium]|uniref:Alpha-N-acetylglucosaminidase n=1 Tax=Sesamum angustifolium TaxID=2727405 RepID=A0AAW2M8N5_9LAMI
MVDLKSFRGINLRVYNSREGLSPEMSSTLPRPHLWYNNQNVVSALKLFLDAGDELAEIPTYRYNLLPS